MAEKLSESDLHVQLSLADLSKEMASLGLPPLFIPDLKKADELRESLLNAAWTLISALHCLSIGNGPHNEGEREARLIDEKCSLQLQIAKLKIHGEQQDKKLENEDVANKTLTGKLKSIKIEVEKQKQQVNLLKQKIMAQENNFKHEIIKRDVECEQLRALIRKRIGLNNEGDKVMASVIDSEDRSSEKDKLTQSTMNRLMISNQELISENLMLRDALQALHADVELLLKTALSYKTSTESINSENHEEHQFPDNVFRLPLSQGMNVIRKLRETQVSSFNDFLSYCKNHLLST